MGYITDFELSWDDYNFEIPKTFEGLNYAIYPDGSTYDSVKWYDYHPNMLKLSKQFPNILFTLSGAGEENDDLWINYYKNGKSQQTKAKIVFEEFDENKLQ